MAAQDGLLVRVKPARGLLQASAAMVLAAASTRFGNGVVQVTNRGNLQFRGLSEDGVAGFADVVTGLGLAEVDAGAERRRNVLVSPLCGVDAGVHPATQGLAEALASMLTGARDFEALPGKFGLVVDGGGLWPMGAAPGDMVVALRGNAVLLSVDRVVAAVLSPADAVAAVREVILAWLRTGAEGRMRADQAAALFEAAGLEGPTTALAGTLSPPVTVGPILPGCFGVGVAFGVMSAGELDALAAVARTGDGMVRITPWRGFVLAGLEAPPEVAGLITSPGDPRLSVVACVGAPACAHASVRTLADAAVFSEAVGIKAEMKAGCVIHVSGCGKGCAHPGAASVVLVGEGGRYNVVRDGRADGVAVRHGLDVSQAADFLRADG